MNEHIKESLYDWMDGLTNKEIGDDVLSRIETNNKELVETLGAEKLAYGGMKISSSDSARVSVEGNLTVSAEGDLTVSGVPNNEITDTIRDPLFTSTVNFKKPDTTTPLNALTTVYDLTTTPVSCDGTTWIDTSISKPIEDWDYTVAASTTPNNTITISGNYGNDVEVVSIDCLSGMVTFGEGYDADEASDTFWQAMGQDSPARLNIEIGKLKRKLEYYTTDAEEVRRFTSEITEEYDKEILSSFIESAKTSPEENYERAMKVLD